MKLPKEVEKTRGKMPVKRFRFLLVNALENRLAQFLYPTNSPQGLLALRAGVDAFFPEVDTKIVSWNQFTPSREQEEFAGLVRGFKPHAVGISSYSNSIPLAIQIASVVRMTLPSAPIILGGTHATAFPDGLFRYPMFDYYVRGEGVRTCPRLLRHLFLGKPDIEAIPSISFKKDGKTALTPLEVLSQDMDENPPIDWTYLIRNSFKEYGVVRLDEKFSLQLHDGPMYPYETSQGCCHNCRFCERVNGRKFRAYSAGRVASDFVSIKKAAGVRYIFINDEHVHYRNGRFKLLLEELVKIRDQGIRYYIAVRAGDIERWMIDLMIDAGVGILHVFPESGSARIRNLMAKDLKMPKFMENVTYASERGLLIFAGFIAGWPGETEKELEATFKLACNPVFDFVFVPMLRCLARSELAPQLKADGIEPDTPEYFHYLNNSWRMIVAGYGLESYRKFMRRIARLNLGKISSKRAGAKFKLLGCSIVSDPFNQAG